MHHSLSACDVGQRKLNSRTSHSLGESDPWKLQPKVFSSNTQGVVVGFYELWSEAIFLPKPLVYVSCGRGILFISRRGKKKNRLICAFTTWKVDLFGQWEVSLPNAALLGRTQDVLAKMNNVLQLVLESVETQPRTVLHRDCISVHLYYSCYTSQFFLLQAHASIWIYPDSPHPTHACLFLTVSNMKKTHGH